MYRGLSDRLPKLASRLNQNPPVTLVLSGPSGFLGSRVLEAVLHVHELRERAGQDPGEVILLSSSPGRLMARLIQKYGTERMTTVRASRVDYFTQHDTETWVDHLGSLGAFGPGTAFMNLAGVAGPRAALGPTQQATRAEYGHGDADPRSSKVSSQQKKRNEMDAVNYAACIGAAAACERLGVGHFVQSSTQATNAERAGQVPYSRGKAMADYRLSQMATAMPVTVARLGLLYCGVRRVIGQDSEGLSLGDLSTLPLTPILGSGTAPLQPQCVEDAALRLAVLGLCPPADRPPQPLGIAAMPTTAAARRAAAEAAEAAEAAAEAPPPSWPSAWPAPSPHLLHHRGAPFRSSDSVGENDEGEGRSSQLRVFDAVGPETLPIVDLLERFAKYQGNPWYNPVFIDYRNMESILNVKSLGNLSRQFVSLLRSEQENLKGGPAVGHHGPWEGILGDPKTEPGAQLTTLDEAFPHGPERTRVGFPFLKLARHVLENPAVVWPGLLLSAEILTNAFRQRTFFRKTPARHPPQVGPSCELDTNPKNKRT